jgi:hypothetical protein
VGLQRVVTGEVLLPGTPTYERAYRELGDRDGQGESLRELGLTLRARTLLAETRP